MSTPYTEIYDFFLPKITEYSFLNMFQSEVELQLKKLLRSAVVDFTNPKIALTKNDTTELFENDLNDDEKEVIATWMLYHFIKPKLVTSELYKQVMSDKDFKLYSQANHIQSLITLMKTLKSDAERLNNKYSFKDRDLVNITDDTIRQANMANGIIPYYDWYLYNGN